MISAVDRYLNTLLAFVPQRQGRRFAGDYVSLIHVPAAGAEKVYSLVFGEQRHRLTVASYKDAVWQVVEQLEASAFGPGVRALQAEIEADHPVCDFLDVDSLRACKSYGDGRPGLDYYLMLWQKDGEADVVECYEPYVRANQAWVSLIGSLQVLSSQFEYALQDD